MNHDYMYLVGSNFQMPIYCKQILPKDLQSMLCLAAT